VQNVGWGNSMIVLLLRILQQLGEEASPFFDTNRQTKEL